MVNHAIEEVLPEVRAPSQYAARVEPSRKSDGIDQIIMMVEGLQETTCKWKEEHDA